MYKEEEAKKKWCPYANVSASDSDIISNRHIQNDNSVLISFSLCIASECMAWRWDYIEVSLDTAGDPTKGYCGLAGKP